MYAADQDPDSPWRPYHGFRAVVHYPSTPHDAYLQASSPATPLSAVSVDHEAAMGIPMQMPMTMAMPNGNFQQQQQQYPQPAFHPHQGPVPSSSVSMPQPHGNNNNTINSNPNNPYLSFAGHTTPAMYAATAPAPAAAPDQQQQLQANLIYTVDHLQNALRYKDSDLVRTKNDLDMATANSQRDREVLRLMEARIAELEELVGKQKATISNQSKAISAPRGNGSGNGSIGSSGYNGNGNGNGQAAGNGNGNGYAHGQGQGNKPRALSFNFATPQHHYHHGSGQGGSRVSRYQHVFNNPPPKFGLATPQSLSQSQSAMSSVERLNAFVPSIGNSPGTGGGGGIGGAEEKVIPLSSLPVDLPEGMMIMEEANFTAMDFGNKFLSVWEKVENFAKTYLLSAPSNNHVTAATAVDAEVAKTLVVASGLESAAMAELLGDPNMRHLVLMRVMNYYLSKKVMHVSVIRGFDSTADSEIGQMIRLMYPGISSIPSPLSIQYIPLIKVLYTDAPLTVRALLHEAIRRQVNRIRNIPLFPNFYNKRKNENANRLWSLIEHLVQRNHPAIWNDYVAIIEETHELALTMFSGPYEFKFLFAEVGGGFEAGTMVGRDAGGMDGNGSGNGNVVKMCVTPTIWFRGNANGMREVMQVVNLANVILSG
ncbi:hypothetical protein FQN50_000156 [Emmonsiellopsis sp. PD_5]|nr:hypothetical protein FQN50_000156 [Emmonsiellopsis sp. PD_5]